MDYIDKNPVKAGLTSNAGGWEASGAYYIQENIPGLVDYDDFTRCFYARQKLLAGPKPPSASGGGHEN